MLTLSDEILKLLQTWGSFAYLSAFFWYANVWKYGGR